jgi:hypothetical protein
LAACIEDDLEQVMVAQVAYDSCQMCEIPKGVPMGYSAFQPLNISRDHHFNLELLEDNNIDALHTLGVRPIRNQFWQYALCNVNRFWQPYKLHQLLLGLVEDLMHQLLKYLKARNVRNQFDNLLISVRGYPSIQHFPKPFDSSESSTWQGQEICGIIRTLALNCAPIHMCYKNDAKTVAETASDEKVMGAVRVLCEFSLLVSQHNHSDIPLKALDDA